MALDICEDPDLRERIVELRTEQESKKLERRRVRRTQSNNSRACSVRRTSVRERGLTAKRDAAQEARFRLVHHQVSKTLFYYCKYQFCCIYSYLFDQIILELKWNEVNVHEFLLDCKIDMFIHFQIRKCPNCSENFCKYKSCRL